MDALTRFELRKITRRKSFYAGIAILAVMIVFMASVLIANTQIRGKDGNYLYGIPAIQLIRSTTVSLPARCPPKKQRMRWNGAIT